MELDLRHAFKFYRDLEHQNQAIEHLDLWLKENHPDQLEKFQQLWRSVPSQEVSREFTSKQKQQKVERVIHLPGLLNDFHLHDSIVPGGSFTWAEATQNGDRIPHTKEAIDRIIVLAEELQVARDQIGKPFHITSWYHARTDGTSNVSAGMMQNNPEAAEAVDFRVDGYTGQQLADELSWWPGGIGTYSYVPYIVHLDMGSYRRWQASYPR